MLLGSILGLAVLYKGVKIVNNIRKGVIRDCWR